MERRRLYLPVFHIDTNLINSRQKLDDVNLLVHWYRNEIILINMSSTARNESLTGFDNVRTKKANEQIFTMTEPLDSADPLFSRIGEAVSYTHLTLPTNREV